MQYFSDDYKQKKQKTINSLAQFFYIVFAWNIFSRAQIFRINTISEPFGEENISY